jgi:hypothetical protein
VHCTSSDNLTDADNQQERLDLAPSQVKNPQRPYAEHLERSKVKIWSDLHGDMQSQAEMPWPLGDAPSGNRNVGPYPMQP